jgi:hypothetical protein
MKRTDDGVAVPGTRHIGIGSWAILIILVILLVATLVVAYLGWTLGEGAQVPASAYVAMAFGVIISLAVGFGLMALLFYSSRKGYDEPPTLLAQDDSTGDGQVAANSQHRSEPDETK